MAYNRKSIAPWIAIGLTAVLALASGIRNSTVTEVRVDTIKTEFQKHCDEQRQDNTELRKAVQDLVSTTTAIKTELELNRQELRNLRSDLRRGR